MYEIKDVVQKHNKFEEIKDTLINSIIKLKDKIETVLYSYEVDDLNRINEMINDLENLKWIEEYEKNYFKYLVKHFQSIINQQYSSFNSYCLNINVDQLIADDSHDIENIKRLVRFFKWNKPLLQKFSNLNGKDSTNSNQDDLDSIKSLREKLTVKLHTFENELIKKMNSDNYYSKIIDVNFLIKIDFFLKKFPFKLLDIETNKTIRNPHSNKQICQQQLLLISHDLTLTFGLNEKEKLLISILKNMIILKE